MKLTRDMIETKLSSFVIPQGECSFRAFEVASLLFDQTINQFPDKRYDSVGDALAEISTALANDQIAILWLDTGLMDPTNPMYRAIHCYFVFDDNPLQCFSIWESPGAAFYKDASIRQKMAETIDLFRNDGGVGLHVIPPPLNHAA